MTLTCSQWLPRSRSAVFRFFADPANLPVISPPEIGARIQKIHVIHPHLPGVAATERMAGTGTEITISFRVIPYIAIRSTWVARIVEFDYANFFRDEQVSGPFKRFVHTHVFQPETRNGEGGTLIRDLVEYDFGYGPLGTVANATAVRMMLSRMFRYRHQATERILLRHS